MMHAPNTFLMFWTAKQLRAWLVELRYRARYPDIWDHLSAPTMKQTREECRRRRMKGFRK